MHTGLVSEHPAVFNVLARPGHCRTLQKQTSVLRFRHFDLDIARRRPF